MDRKKVIGGFLWQYAERFSVQGISFLVTIILARLLLPEEYGVVSIATIFITLLEVFVISGWGNALVQKKKATSVDFSSVFYFNIVFSVILFLCVWWVAPIIGDFYKQSKLVSVLQWMSFRIVVSSFNSVQQAYVQRNLLFKRQFYSSLSGTVFSAIFGIWAAYRGFGVYALVIQYLSNAIINTIVLFITIKWRPTLEFSIDNLKGLIKYGWKLLGSGLLNTAFAELKGFVIGGKYSSTDLAYYDRGKQFPSLIYDNINTSIGKVLFPLMSQAQDNILRIQSMTRLSLQIMSSLLIPILYILFIVGDSLISVLLTDKWLPAVSFLRVTCITFSFVIPNTVFTNAINSIGRSDLHLKVETLNIISGIIILLSVMNLGAIYIALSVTLSNVICVIVRVVISHNLMNFKLKYFYNDFIKPYLFSLLALIPTWLIGYGIDNDYYALFFKPLIFVGFYFAFIFWFNKSVYMQIRNLFNHYI